MSNSKLEVFAAYNSWFIIKRDNTRIRIRFLNLRKRFVIAFNNYIGNTNINGIALSRVT